MRLFCFDDFPIELLLLLEHTEEPDRGILARFKCGLSDEDSFADILSSVCTSTLSFITAEPLLIACGVGIGFESSSDEIFFNAVQSTLISVG